jgi:hypothetical protein
MYHQFQPNGLTSFCDREKDFRRSGRLTLDSVVFTEFPRVETVTLFSAIGAIQDRLQSALDPIRYIVLFLFDVSIYNPGSRDRWLMDPPCLLNHHRHEYTFFFRIPPPPFRLYSCITYASPWCAKRIGDRLLQKAAESNRSNPIWADKSLGNHTKNSSA